MGYLVCQECGGDYKLQEGESKDDFASCECYGALVYVESIEDYFNPDERSPGEVRDKSSDNVLIPSKNESTTSVTENLEDNSSDSNPDEPVDKLSAPILDKPEDILSAPIFEKPEGRSSVPVLEKPEDKSSAPIPENMKKKDPDIKLSAFPEEMAVTSSKITSNSD